MTEAIGSSAGTCDGRLGNMGASPMPLPSTGSFGPVARASELSTARTSMFVGETPHRGLSCSSSPSSTARAGGPSAIRAAWPRHACAHAICHPSGDRVAICREGAFAATLDAHAVCHPARHRAAMSREGTSRYSGPPEPRQGSCTASVRWTDAVPLGPRSHLTRATAERPEVRDRPVRARELQQARHKAVRQCLSDHWLALAERQAERDLYRQTGLNRCVTVDRLRAMLARRRHMTGRRRVEPGGQRTALTQRGVVARPVQCVVAGGCRLGYGA